MATSATETTLCYVVIPIFPDAQGPTRHHWHISSPVPPRHHQRISKGSLPGPRGQRRPSPMGAPQGPTQHHRHISTCSSPGPPGQHQPNRMDPPQGPTRHRRHISACSSSGPPGQHRPTTWIPHKGPRDIVGTSPRAAPLAIKAPSAHLHRQLTLAPVSMAAFAAFFFGMCSLAAGLDSTAAIPPSTTPRASWFVTLCMHDGVDLKRRCRCTWSPEPTQILSVGASFLPNSQPSPSPSRMRT